MCFPPVLSFSSLAAEPARRPFLFWSVVRGSVGGLPLDGTLEAGIFQVKDLKRYVVGSVFIQKQSRQNTTSTVSSEFAGGRKQSSNK